MTQERVLAIITAGFTVWILWTTPSMRLMAASIAIAMAGVAFIVALVAWDQDSPKLAAAGLGLTALAVAMYLWGRHGDRKLEEAKEGEGP